MGGRRKEIICGRGRQSVQPHVHHTHAALDALAGSFALSAHLAFPYSCRVKGADPVVSQLWFCGIEPWQTQHKPCSSVRPHPMATEAPASSVVRTHVRQLEEGDYHKGAGNVFGSSPVFEMVCTAQPTLSMRCLSCCSPHGVQTCRLHGPSGAAVSSGRGVGGGVQGCVVLPPCACAHATRYSPTAGAAATGAY